jgi:TetR/AcrR family transcriptional regulator, lmrAB and yxaGH operons repressor
MGKATDTRQRMIDGARDLIRRNGFGSTSLKDVWEYTGTPRGSVYFHFPGGKEEIGLEVLQAVANRLVHLTRLTSSRTRTVETFIRGVAKALADELEASGYLDSCAVVAISSEVSSVSPTLRAASASALEAWSASLALELQRKGIAGEEAGPLAGVVVSGLEGARVVAKATSSREPLDNMGDALASLPAVARRRADRAVRSRPAAPRAVRA